MLDGYELPRIRPLTTFWMKRCSNKCCRWGAYFAKCAPDTFFFTKSQESTFLTSNTTSRALFGKSLKVNPCLSCKTHKKISQRPLFSLDIHRKVQGGGSFLSKISCLSSCKHLFSLFCSLFSPNRQKKNKRGKQMLLPTNYISWGKGGIFFLFRWLSPAKKSFLFSLCFTPSFSQETTFKAILFPTSPLQTRGNNEFEELLLLLLIEASGWVTSNL